MLRRRKTRFNPAEATNVTYDPSQLLTSSQLVAPELLSDEYAEALAEAAAKADAANKKKERNKKILIGVGVTVAVVGGGALLYSASKK